MEFLLESGKLLQRDDAGVFRTFWIKENYHRNVLRHSRGGILLNVPLHLEILYKIFPLDYNALHQKAEISYVDISQSTFSIILFYRFIIKL